MAHLTEAQIEQFKAAKLYPLATASADGEPNVAPVGAVEVVSSDTIWIGNQFMNATIANLRENPRASLYALVQEPRSCLKIKADVTIVTDGPDYERMRGLVKKRRAELECRALLVLKINGVYDCRSGPEAGKRLA